jgi:hypothetical protein
MGTAAAPEAGPLRVRTAIVGLLETRSLTHYPMSYTRFERGGPRAEEVSADRIPGAVRQRAADWVARVVRSPWVPTDCSERFAGETRTVDYVPPDNVDYLFLDYAAAGSSFRLAEDGTALSVLWANPNIMPGHDPGKTAVLLAQILLKVPDEEAPKMQAEINEVSAGEVRLFCGRIRIPLEPLPKEQYENTLGRNPYWHKQWYHDMFVWLADGYFYVSVAERTGQPPRGPEDMQARAGYRPRFLPTGDASGAADPPTGAPPAADD